VTEQYRSFGSVCIA